MRFSLFSPFIVFDYEMSSVGLWRRWATQKDLSVYVCHIPPVSGMVFCLTDIVFCIPSYDL